LAVMRQQSVSQVSSLKRLLFASAVRRGILTELKKEFDGAIVLYHNALNGITLHIEKLRADYERLREERRNDKRNQHTTSSEDELDEEELDFAMQPAADGALSDELDFFQAAQARLLSWLALHHQALFCLASVQLHLERKEISDELYQRAEDVRKELMKPAEQQALRGIQSCKTFHDEANLSQKLAGLKAAPSPSEGGIVLWPSMNISIFSFLIFSC
jgi:hypothetical protein